MKPHIVVYCCTNSTVMPEDHVEKLTTADLASVQCVRLPCSGRSDVLHIVRAVEQGADMALVVGCAQGKCQYIEGNERAEKRVRYANRLLAEAGLGRERVRMIHLAPGDNGKFAAELEEMAAKAAQWGSWLPKKG